MSELTYADTWPDIDTGLYKRSVKLLRAVKNLLSVKISLHAYNQMIQGDIFLFNHFSRFETFIPQFLMYEKTGAYSCSIASSEFFVDDSFLADYLQHVGVFPHDHPRLFALMAEQILRGRKVIVFPEGGMVKDRRVIDKNGQYSIYSRITGKRRKHHTGSAVLGQGVDAIKSAIRLAFKNKDSDRLQHWKEQLHFDSLDELLAVALKPTLIVPANITFYPIRSSENLLFKSVELLSDDLTLRQAEELLIEGNILLKDTDMDIRMGVPVNPCCDWDWRTQWLMQKVASDMTCTDDAFRFTHRPKNLKQRLLGHYFVKNAKCSRNQYMKRIYANVTINLSHLAATLLMIFMDANSSHIEKSHFYTVLYIAIKNLQKNTRIHLHRSLLNPDEYGDLVHGLNARFDHFICIAKEAELIAEQDECYYFLPKLREDHHFDQIRLENPIAVYHNEAAPLKAVREALLEADRSYQDINPHELAAWHLQDEQLILAFEQQNYNQQGAQAYKQTETATADPSPFFIRPRQANGFGVLLIHGLLASPAELRDYGHYLAEKGFTVLGVRIKGHGTAASALRELSFEQWFESVKRGFNILKMNCSKLFVVGFSTGAALGCKLAAENHSEIAGLVAVSVPIKFVNSNFMLIPLLHNTNTLVHWVSSFEGVKPYLENEPEHPDINYCNVPVRALYELRRLINHVEALLADIETPTLLLYADEDPVVSYQSAETLFSKLGSKLKKQVTVHADRHGILMENIDNSWCKIDKFLAKQQKNPNFASVKPHPVI